jgi:hypothetical protein
MADGSMTCHPACSRASGPKPRSASRSSRAPIAPIAANAIAAQTTMAADVMAFVTSGVNIQ